MAIRWDKFTIKAQEAIQQASDIASQHGNPEMLSVSYTHLTLPTTPYV